MTEILRIGDKLFEIRQIGQFKRAETEEILTKKEKIILLKEGINKLVKISNVLKDDSILDLAHYLCLKLKKLRSDEC